MAAQHVSEILLNVTEKGEPRLHQSYELRMIGDWGGANFHRICAWLTQEFCDRAGPGSRSSIQSLRDGGMDALLQLANGEADLAIATPAALMRRTLTGAEPFPEAMPQLRALATLPQNDRMVFGIDPKYNITSFEGLRKQKPAIRLATSTNDGTNFIGFIADRFLEAHGITVATIKTWGGSVLRAHRPEQCVALVEEGKADALLQEAIMTPWWRNLIESHKLHPLPAETQALDTLNDSLGLGTNVLPAGFWDNLLDDLPALDFSDFVVFVRHDMPQEVAYLLAWCLVETKHLIEAQYQHLPPPRSPLSYPLEPKKMAATPIALHDGARKYYEQAGHVQKEGIIAKGQS